MVKFWALQQYFNYENEISQDLMINDERNDRDTVKRQRQRHRLLTLIISVRILGW